jgi:hypothetical protein
MNVQVASIPKRAASLLRGEHENLWESRIDFQYVATRQSGCLTLIRSAACSCAVLCSAVLSCAVLLSAAQCCSVLLSACCTYRTAVVTCASRVEG